MNTQSEEKELMNHPGFYKDDNLEDLDLNLENIGRKKSLTQIKNNNEGNDLQYSKLDDNN